jgi:hypothetical protein
VIDRLCGQLPSNIVIDQNRWEKVGGTLVKPALVIERRSSLKVLMGLGGASALWLVRRFLPSPIRHFLEPLNSRWLLFGLCLLPAETLLGIALCRFGHKCNWSYGACCEALADPYYIREDLPGDSRNRRKYVEEFGIVAQEKPTYLSLRAVFGPARAAVETRARMLRADDHFNFCFQSESELIAFSEGVTSLSDEITNQIHGLRLVNTIRLCPRGDVALRRILESTPNLRDVDFHGVVLGTLAGPMISLLVRCKELTCLHLDHAELKLGRSELEELGQCPALKILGLSGALLTDGSASLLPVLRQRELVTLRLHGVELDVKALCQQVRQARNSAQPDLCIYLGDRDLAFILALAKAYFVKPSQEGDDFDEDAVPLQPRVQFRIRNLYQQVNGTSLAQELNKWVFSSERGILSVAYGFQPFFEQCIEQEGRI